MNDKPDLGAVFDRHLRYEFDDKDVEATMTTMVAQPCVWNVPTGTGGIGRADVRRFYAEQFLGHMPADTQISNVSRTIGDDQLVDELVLSFTHDVEIPYLLPGLAPTGRRVVLAHVVVVRFEADKIAHEHIYWDQASLLAQVGLIDPSALPILGAAQADLLRRADSRAAATHPS